MKIVVIGGAAIGSKLVTRLREHGHEAAAAGLDTFGAEGLAAALANAAVVIDVSNPPSVRDVAAPEFFETATRNLLAAEMAAGVGHHVELSAVGIEPVLFQPVAQDDAAEAVGKIAAGPPLNGTAEVAGPEQFRMDEFFRKALAARNGAVLGATRYRNWPGRAAAGDNSVLHELELSVRAELIRAETSPPPDQAVDVPIDEWLSDPADDQRYEASLRSLLGAVEALEDGSFPAAEGW